MKKIITHLLLLCLIVACSTQGDIPDENNRDINDIIKPVECTDKRPEFCTMDYRPVCATKDNGIRCIKAPCDSTDEVTYSNACVACSDQDVYSHVSGECK